MHAYSTNDSRVRIYAYIATVSVLISILVTYILGTTLDHNWLISSPALVGIYLVVYQLFDRWLWRWRLLSQIGIVNERDISGTYKGNLVTNYEQRKNPLLVKITIDQNWSKILICFETGEKRTTSTSLIAHYEGVSKNLVRLTYTYRSKINAGIADADMEDNEGTAELRIKPDGSVEGNYFSSRPRKGTFTLKKTSDSSVK